MITNKPLYKAKMKIKKGDEVLILSGKDKGKKGKVLETTPDAGKVRVEGINLVKKHQKPKSSSSRGMVKQQLGEILFPMGLPLSKVMLICPKCHKETRVASGRSDDGKVARKCQKCNEWID